MPFPAFPYKSYLEMIAIRKNNGVFNIFIRKALATREKTCYIRTYDKDP